MEVEARLVPVVERTHVALARRCAAEIAARIAFDEVTSGRLAIAVTEAATNLIKHAGGGEVFVGPTGNHPTRGVQIIAMDRGRGIANVTTSLRDGYSTSGTAGTGLGAIHRASTTFDVYTSNTGTVLATTIFPAAPSLAWVGGISVPMPGQTCSGDDWAAWSAGELTSILLCDGLGHGPDAAVAARQAIDTFHRHAEQSTTEVLARVHDALRGTRGAAVAIAELDRRAETIRYCGLGNISATVVTPEGREHRLVSLSGIAGHVMRRLQEFVQPWTFGSVLVMHSDGVGTHWSLSSYAGLVSRRPDVIAGVLYRDHRRERDDATVVVTRNMEAA